MALAGIVVVADAQALATQLADAYVGDTVRQQLAAADLLLLNKIDGVSLAQRQALQRQLGLIAPCARLIESVQAELPIEVLGQSLDDDHRDAPDSGRCWP